MTPDEKKPMTADEWLEGHYKRHPPRRDLDPDKCAEVVEILIRSSMDRPEEKNAATAEGETGDDQDT